MGFAFFNEESGVFSKNTEFSPEDVMNYVKLSASEKLDEQKENTNNTEVMLLVLGGTLLLLIFAVILLQVKIIKGKKSKKKVD